MYLNISGNKYEIVVIRKDNRNTYIRVKEDLRKISGMKMRIVSNDKFYVK